jgi:hypothetical protein
MAIRDSFSSEGETPANQFLFEKDENTRLGFSPCSYIDWEKLGLTGGAEQI